LTEPSGFR